MKRYKTEQEQFWAEHFGDNYILRNQNYKVNIPFFTKILSSTNNIQTILEFGSNIGLNLRAIKEVLPEVEVSAIEINYEAVKELKKMECVKIYHQSVLDFKADYKRDFILIKGVLIHINPDYLNEVYESLYNASKRYICIAEYYNPSPVELEYRGYSEKLYKRDFAGELLEKYSDLELVDYGFVYHRDNYFPQDDITWFLLEKRDR